MHTTYILSKWRKPCVLILLFIQCVWSHFGNKQLHSPLLHERHNLKTVRSIFQRLSLIFCQTNSGKQFQIQFSLLLVMHKLRYSCKIFVQTELRVLARVLTSSSCTAGYLLHSALVWGSVKLNSSFKFVLRAGFVHALWKNNLNSLK